MTDYHQFIITTMDMHTIDLEPYRYSGTNITGIRLVDPENPMMEHITNCMGEENAEEDEENNGEEPESYDEEMESDDEELEDDDEEPESEEEEPENEDEEGEETEPTEDEQEPESCKILL